MEELPTVSLQGPVELHRGELTLRIPLSAGGAELVDCAGSIGHIEGEYLNVVIPPWLADKLGIVHGSRVAVDNEGGKFNITLVGPEGGTDA